MPLGTKIGLGPGPIVLDGDPAPLPNKGGTAPNFRPISIVAKWSPISATAEHLFKMSAVRHLGFVSRVLDHSQRVFDSLDHCAKFGCN